MLKDEIVVGRSYVNEDACIVREVVEEVDDRHVKYQAFELESGRLLPARHRVCEKRDLARWASRLADPDEVARIHPFEPASALDSPFPPDRRDARLEEAMTAIHGTPGAHTFPRIK